MVESRKVSFSFGLANWKSETKSNVEKIFYSGELIVQTRQGNIVFLPGLFIISIKIFV